MIAEQSSSSRTRSRTRGAAWPAGTKSCTDGGRSQISSTAQGRKVLLMQTANHRWGTVSSKFSRYRDTLLAPGLRQGGALGWDASHEHHSRILPQSPLPMSAANRCPCGHGGGSLHLFAEWHIGRASDWEGVPS